MVSQCPQMSNAEMSVFETFQAAHLNRKAPLPAGFSHLKRVKKEGLPCPCGILAFEQNRTV